MDDGLGLRCLMNSFISHCGPVHWSTARVMLIRAHPLTSDWWEVDCVQRELACPVDFVEFCGGLNVHMYNVM